MMTSEAGTDPDRIHWRVSCNLTGEPSVLLIAHYPCPRNTVITILRSVISEGAEHVQTHV